MLHQSPPLPSKDILVASLSPALIMSDNLQKCVLYTKVAYQNMTHTSMSGFPLAVLFEDLQLSTMHRNTSNLPMLTTVPFLTEQYTKTHVP